MRDTRYDWVRGRTTRRGLVALLLGLIAALVPAYLLGGAVLGVVVGAGGVAVLALLRVATRIVPDAPPALPDERQAQTQGQVYVTAYRLVAATVMLLATAVFLLVLLSPEPEAVAVTVGIDLVSGAVLALFGLRLAAPTCVHAWQRERV